MENFQQTLGIISTMFDKHVTNKSLETNFDHHQEETSFLGFDHIPSFFMGSHSHPLGDMHH